MAQLFGGIEAGGTWFTCAIGTGSGDLRAQTRFATTTPDETLRRDDRIRRRDGHPQ